MGSSRNTLYEAVLEALPCEIVVHDGECIVLANGAACRTLGAMSPRSLVGLPLSALVHSADDAHDGMRQVSRTGQAAPATVMSLRFSELGGDSITFDACARGFSVGPEDYAVLVRCRYTSSLCGPDVAALEFPEGTSLARATLDSLLQPVTVYDGDDHFLFSNVAAQHAFVGAEQPALAGQPVGSVIHPIARDAAAERRKLVLDAGQSFPHIEAKLRRLDGSALHAIGSLGSARLPGGVRVGYWIAHAIGDGQLADTMGSA